MYVLPAETQNHVCSCEGVFFYNLYAKTALDVNFVLRLLHLVVMGDIADVLEVHAATIISADVCRLVNYCVHAAFFENE
jgi:hypothetical protein